jgi:GNAT superfamily N-acetyltransferase
MVVAPSVRPFREQEWRTYRDLRLRALADSPDAYGGTLAGEAIRADAAWADRLVLGADRQWDLPLLAESGAEPIGLAWGKIDKSGPALANVYQMWVAPTHRGLGAGRLLLDLRDAALCARWIFSCRRGRASSIGVNSPGAADANAAVQRRRLT